MDLKKLKDLSEEEKSKLCGEVLAPLFKIGFEYRLTDKGKHQCSVLRSQYMQGLKMGVEALAKLTALYIHDNKYTFEAFHEGEILTRELQDQIGYEYDLDGVQEQLIAMGLMEKNPDHNREVGLQLREALDKL